MKIKQLQMSIAHWEREEESTLLFQKKKLKISDAFSLGSSCPDIIIFPNIFSTERFTGIFSNLQALATVLLHTIGSKRVAKPQTMENNGSKAASAFLFKYEFSGVVKTTIK